MLTSDATKIAVESHGGGFVPTPPAGSTCGMGASKLTLEIGSKSLSWAICRSPDLSKPLALATGSRTLTAAELTAATKALAGIKVRKSEICGADKPMETGL